MRRDSKRTLNKVNERIALIRVKPSSDYAIRVFTCYLVQLTKIAPSLLRNVKIQATN